MSSRFKAIRVVTKNLGYGRLNVTLKIRLNIEERYMSLRFRNVKVDISQYACARAFPNRHIRSAHTSSRRRSID